MYFIYKHTNKFNRKIYIGQTKQIPEKRWGNGMRYNKFLQHDINVYGWNAGFTHDIILKCNSKEEADLYEKYYIIFYQSINYGYNILPGGDSIPQFKKIKSNYTNNKKFSKYMSIYNLTKKEEVFYGYKKDMILFLKKNIILDKKLKVSNIYLMYKNNYKIKSELNDNVYIIRKANKRSSIS